MIKKLLTLSIISLFSTISFANTFTYVDCDSTRGTGNNLQIEIVNNKDIFTTKLNGILKITHKLNIQNIDGITLYTVAGASSLMEVENSIFESGTGHVNLNGEEFSCN